jgi:hypothetical protein
METAVETKTLLRKLAAGRRYHARHPELHLDRNRAWRLANPVKKLLQAARERARTREVEFNLVEADLLPVPTHCAVFGCKLNYGGGHGRNGRGVTNYNAASLDRKDNSKGYVRGNVEIISLRANMLKSNGTAAEHRAIAEWMEK